MAAGKINLQANDGKVLGLYAPDGMGVNTDIVPANVNGDATKAFKVSDAVNADEAVSKAQLDLKATLTEVQAYDLGVGQTWQDMTVSRSAGVTYTNTTGKPITVYLRIGGTNSNYNIFSISLDNISLNDAIGNIPAYPQTARTLIVPNGSTYKYSNISGTTILSWLELR